jgi:hypothetical protein
MFGHMAAESTDLQRPIVILAVPRSGSQLMRMLLNAHPDAFIAAYSNLLGELSNPKVSWERAGEILRYEHDDTRRSPDHLSRFLRTLYYSFWTTSGELEWLKKATPSRWGFIHYAVPADMQSVSLIGLFPQARYVHIVRDGRNVVASWLANWQLASARMPVARRAPAAVAELWTRWVRAARAYAPLEIKLEDLHDPERRPAVVAKLLSHCGLTACPAFDAYAAQLPFVNAEKESVSRWRTDLDRETLAAVYAVPGFEEELTAHGYER